MMCLTLVISQGIGLLSFSSGSSFPDNTQPAAGLLQAKLAKIYKLLQSVYSSEWLTSIIFFLCCMYVCGNP